MDVAFAENLPAALWRHSAREAAHIRRTSRAERGELSSDEEQAT